MHSYSDLIFLDGKYMNESVDEIIKKDPSYCHYLVYKYKSYIPKDIKNILSIHFPNPDEYFMSFGPYKTKTLNWIKDNEPEYLHFLKNDNYVQTKCHILKQKLNEML